MLSTARVETLYLSLPSALRQRIPLGLKARMRAWLLPERAQRSAAPKPARKDPIKDLDAKLWAGFAAPAAEAIHAIAGNPRARKAERVHAYTSLARWHLQTGEPAEALACARQIRSLRGGALDPKLVSLEIECLLRTGHLEEAQGLVASLGESALAGSAQLALAASGVYALLGDEERRVALLNRPLLREGLAPVRGEGDRPLSFATATSTPETRGAFDRIPVSVLLPCFNAEATITKALEGLGSQTWRNLEVVVVDDASTDGTAAAVAEFARSDPRVRLYRLEANGGAYAARNFGLERCEGDLVTVHDADDWSHPEKIQRQVAALLGDPCAAASIGVHCRIDDDFNPIRGHYLGLNFLKPGHSSLLFRRDVVAEIGPWDTFRLGGDKEFIFRMQEALGKRAVVRCLPEVPLYFSLHHGASLTQAPGIGALTSTYGVRKEYRSRWKHWHRSLRKETGIPDPGEDDASEEGGEEQSGGAAEARSEAPGGPGPAQRGAVRLERRDGTTPFAIADIDPARREPKTFDIVILSDFTMKGGTRTSLGSYIEFCRAQGYRTGIFHWPRFDRRLDDDIDPRFREMVNRGEIAVVLPSDTVRSRIALVYHPPVASHLLAPMPAFDCREVIVLVNQMPFSYTSKKGREYDPAAVHANLAAVFGREATWIANSPLVLRLMTEDPEMPAPHPEVWGQIVDIDRWCTRRPVWRGRERDRPVIGRHSRDVATKWPNAPEVLEAVFPPDCEVRILGGCTRAERVLSGVSRTWTVYEFDSIPPKQFLKDLDFFVYFTHPDYIEENSRSVTEALSLGVPVITDRSFAEVFGDAAVCIEPERVRETVTALWRDEARYLELAARGQAYVRENCGYAACRCRFDAFLGPDAA